MTRPCPTTPLATALSPFGAGGRLFFLDGPLLLLAALGVIGWSLPRPVVVLPLGTLALKALAEELVFRLWLQDGLDARLGRTLRLGPLSLANVAASAAFSAVHLVNHQPLAALSVFLPSLAFGLAWDRHRTIWAPWALHLLYNACYFHKDAMLSFFS